VAVSVIVLRGGLVEDHGVACFGVFVQRGALTGWAFGLHGVGIGIGIGIGLDWIGPPIEAFGTVSWFGLDWHTRSIENDTICYAML
jgi:hypothetical protein